MNEKLFKENKIELNNGVLMITNRNNILSYLDINDLIQVKSNDLVLEDINESDYKNFYEVISHCEIHYSIRNECYVISYGCCKEFLLFGDWRDEIMDEIEIDGEEAVEEKYCFEENVSFQSFQKAVDYFICVLYSFNELCE